MDDKDHEIEIMDDDASILGEIEENIKSAEEKLMEEEEKENEEKRALFSEISEFMRGLLEGNEKRDKHILTQLNKLSDGFDMHKEWAEERDIENNHNIGQVLTEINDEVEDLKAKYKTLKFMHSLVSDKNIGKLLYLCFGFIVLFTLYALKGVWWAEYGIFIICIFVLMFISATIISWLVIKTYLIVKDMFDNFKKNTEIKNAEHMLKMKEVYEKGDEKPKDKQPIENNTKKFIISRLSNKTNLKKKEVLVEQPKPVKRKKKVKKVPMEPEAVKIHEPTKEEKSIIDRLNDKVNDTYDNDDDELEI